MAKQINEETLHLTFTLRREAGVGVVEITGDARYDVRSDDLVESRTIIIDKLTTAQINGLKGIGAAVIQSIKQKEGV